MGIARVAFMHKKFADAQKLYAEVSDRFGNLAVAAEALYWRASRNTKLRMITQRWARSRVN